MPQLSIPAAGEAMPAEGQSRRRFLTSAAAIAAMPARPAFAIDAAAFMAGDPIFALIEEH